MLRLADCCSTCKPQPLSSDMLQADLRAIGYIPRRTGTLLASTVMVSRTAVAHVHHTTRETLWRMYTTRLEKQTVPVHAMKTMKKSPPSRYSRDGGVVTAVAGVPVITVARSKVPRRIRRGEIRPNAWGMRPVKLPAIFSNEACRSLLRCPLAWVCVGFPSASPPWCLRAASGG